MLYFRTDSNVPLRSTVAEASQAIAEEVAPVHQPETSQQERATPQAESSASSSLSIQSTMLSSR